MLMPHDSTTSPPPTSRASGAASSRAAGPSAFASLVPTGAYAHLPPIPLHRPITLIGSRRTARIHLNSTDVSRAHALLVVRADGTAHLRDLHSRVGTLVDGRAITEHRLRDGEQIAIAGFSFTFRDRAGPPQPGPTEPPIAAVEIHLPRGRGQAEGPHVVRLDGVVTLVGQRAGSDV